MSNPDQSRAEIGRLLELVGNQDMFQAANLDDLIATVLSLAVGQELTLFELQRFRAAIMLESERRLIDAAAKAMIGMAAEGPW